jgi:hypothetical protein
MVFHIAGDLLMVPALLRLTPSGMPDEYPNLAAASETPHACTARRAADLRNRTIRCLAPCDFLITTPGACVSLLEPAVNPLVYLTGAQ